MSLLYDTHFPGGFHDSGYHALMEMSRYNYNITHLYVYLFPCVYVVLRRSQAGRWSMQRASDQCRRGSGALRHYLKLQPCADKNYVFHQ